MELELNAVSVNRMITEPLLALQIFIITGLVCIFMLIQMVYEKPSSLRDSRDEHGLSNRMLAFRVSQYNDVNSRKTCLYFYFEINTIGDVFVCVFD